MTSPITPQTTVLELGQYLSAKEATFSAGYSSGLWHFAVSMDGRMVIGEGADLVTAIGRALEQLENKNAAHLSGCAALGWSDSARNKT